MIFAYAFIGVVIGLPLIVFAGIVGGVGGFIHGRINRWRRQRAAARHTSMRTMSVDEYQGWLRSRQ